jgi:TM2 domain-containing membrane protein YozV
VNPVCPYCRTEIVAEADASGRLDCPGCATPHHPECFAENGGCTVFGCSKAPADEGKISVTGSDLHPAPQPPPRQPLTLAGGFSIFGSPNLAAIPPVQPTPTPAAAPTPPPPLPPPSATGAAPPPMPSPQQPAYAPAPNLLPRLSSNARAKSRVAFVLLGIFLGIFGMHNFYAGYNKKAAIQLALTILTFFYAAVVTWVWAIIEVCVVNQDSEGEQFA